METPKRFWDDISKLILTKKKNTGKINLNDSTGNPLPEKEVADHINGFFTCITTTRKNSREASPQWGNETSGGVTFVM